jgi:putative heme transporter
VTGISLYLVAPSLIELLSSAPRLGKLDPVWLVVMVALEAASFATVWMLQWICLAHPSWRPVVLSQLAGNTLAKIAPGGGAAGGAFQYRMLVESRMPAAVVASGLAAANLLTFAVLAALPVLTVPAFLAGLPIDKGLVRAMLLGIGLFVALAAVGGLLLVSDRALRAVGRVAQATHNRVLRRRRSLEGFPTKLVTERDRALHVIGTDARQALLAAVLRWLLDYCALLLALAAVGAEPRPSLVLIAYTASALLAFIPVTPGGLGFVEAGLTGLLALAGVNAADAALATLAYRLVSYWLPLPAGGVAIVLHRRALGKDRAPSPRTSASESDRGASRGDLM